MKKRLVLGGGLICLILGAGAWFAGRDQLAQRVNINYSTTQKLWEFAGYYWNRNDEGYIGGGRQLFLTRCSVCHGAAGSDGWAPDLTNVSPDLVSDDLDLYRTLRYGIADTQMPGMIGVDGQVLQVAAYVRSLNQSGDSQQLPDNAVETGHQLVREKGNCLGCHTIGSEGGTTMLGPDLSNVGRLRSSTFLRNKLLAPAEWISPEQGLFRAVTRDGQTVDGFRLREDSFAVHLRDVQGDLHSFWRADLSSFEELKDSPMPSYQGVFSEEELDYVIAYLSSLRGGP